MTTDTIRLGRHTVARGDRVRVLPSPGKRDGFVAVFHSAHLDDDEVVEITVIGGRNGRPRAYRTFAPWRVAWMRQPREDA